MRGARAAIDRMGADTGGAAFEDDFAIDSLNEIELVMEIEDRSGIAHSEEDARALVALLLRVRPLLDDDTGPAGAGVRAR